MNNIYNLADYRTKKSPIPEGGYVSSPVLEKKLKTEVNTALIASVFHSNSPHLMGDDIVELLRNILSEYGDMGYGQFMNGIKQQPVENISLSRKSAIFGIAHFVLYGKAIPSAYILYAMILANQSAVLSVISDMQHYINGAFNVVGIDKLISLGDDLINAGWMKEAELQEAEKQLTEWMKPATFPISKN